MVVCLMKRLSGFFYNLFHDTTRPDKAEMIRLAQAECELRGWEWAEPVRVELSCGRWTISTNSDIRGCNAIFRFDRAGRRILSANMLPR